MFHNSFYKVILELISLLFRSVEPVLQCSVQIPSQWPLVPSVTSVTLSANYNIDNNMVS